MKLVDLPVEKKRHRRRIELVSDAVRAVSAAGGVEDSTDGGRKIATESVRHLVLDAILADLHTYTDACLLRIAATASDRAAQMRSEAAEVRAEAVLVGLGGDSGEAGRMVEAADAMRRAADILDRVAEA